MRRIAKVVSLILIAAFSWFFISTVRNPYHDIWEQSRVLGSSFKTFESFNPFFLAVFFMVWGYRLSLEHSRRVTDKEARAKYFPLEASLGALASMFLIAGILVASAESMLKEASAKIEKIILLCDNDLDLQKRYATMDSKSDYLAFLKAAKAHCPSNQFISTELAQMGVRNADNASNTK